MRKKNVGVWGRLTADTVSPPAASAVAVAATILEMHITPPAELLLFLLFSGKDSQHERLARHAREVRLLLL